MVKRVVDFSLGCFVGFFLIFVGMFLEVFFNVGILENIVDGMEKKLVFNGNWNGVS